MRTLGFVHGACLMPGVKELPLVPGPRPTEVIIMYIANKITQRGTRTAERPSACIRVGYSCRRHGAEATREVDNWWDRTRAVNIAKPKTKPRSAVQYSSGQLFRIRGALFRTKARSSDGRNLMLSPAKKRQAAVKRPGEKRALLAGAYACKDTEIKNKDRQKTKRQTALSVLALPLRVGRSKQSERAQSKTCLRASSNSVWPPKGGLQCTTGRRPQT